MDYISSTITAVSVLVTASSTYRSLLLRIYLLSSAPTQEKLCKSYGALIALGVTSFLLNAAEQWERIDELLTEPEEVIFAFQRSYTSDCTQTAVAGAIVAQIAVTALSLPSLSQVHWAARALFVVSLVTGLLSVYYAVLLQRTIGALYKVTDIKNWLSSPKSIPSPEMLSSSLKQLEELQRTVQDLKENKQTALIEDIQVELQENSIWVRPEEGALQKFERQFFNSDIQVTASLFSAQMLVVPATMINMSLVSFLSGFGVYLGILWTRKLDQDAGPSGSRDVFIVFLVCISASWLFYLIARILKNHEILPFQLKRRLLNNLKALLDEAVEQGDKLQQQRTGPNDVPTNGPGETGSGGEVYAQRRDGEIGTNDGVDQISPVGDPPPPNQQTSSSSQHNLLKALEQAMAAQEASARASSLAAEEYRNLIHSIRL